MQGTEKRTQNENMSTEEFLAGIDPDQAYCSATSRIVIISSLPQLIHEMVRELTAACYDVMVFHSMEPAMLLQLKPHLLIADMTRPFEDTDWEWLDSVRDKGFPVLQLVRQNQAGANSDTVLEWPLPEAGALPVVQPLMEASWLKGAAAPAAFLRTEEQLRLKDLSMDLSRYVVELNGSRVDLTKTEFDLLRVILEAEGKALTRQELMDSIWGDGYYGGSNTMDVHVKTLRQKLKDNPRDPQYVATVRGIGYRAVIG